MSPRLHCLYRYWRDRHHADGTLPRRIDLDPVAIARAAPELIPHLWLLDVERDPYRFRYRLVGGALVEAGAPGKVGEYVDAIGDRAGSRSLHDNLVALCETKTWNYRGGPPTLPHSAHVEVVERLSLPLVDETGEVVMIISGSVYGWQEGWGRSSR